MKLDMKKRNKTHKSWINAKEIGNTIWSYMQTSISFSFFVRLSGCKFKKPHHNSADSHEAKHRLEHTEKSLLGEYRL